MRIVFMGTAELASPCLTAVAKLAAQEVVGVITQPDRPQGRHLRLEPPPVKVTAGQLGLPVQQPERIREPAAIDTLRALRPDLVIVVAYGQILPPSVLEIPPAGCVNVHASLLPRWRGAAPIQHAILHGDRATGVTTMYLAERMDTGDIILQRAEPIQPADTSATLQGRLADLGAALLGETVALIAAHRAPRTKQDESQATYAKKLAKEDGRIDWRQPAEFIERQIRAFAPWPSAYTAWAALPLKVWGATVVRGVTGRPGEVMPGQVIACGQDGLQFQQVQPAGSKRMSFAAFWRGHELPPGSVLPSGQ